VGDGQEMMQVVGEPHPKYVTASGLPTWAQMFARMLRCKHGRIHSSSKHTHNLGSRAAASACCGILKRRGEAAGEIFQACRLEI